MYMQILDQLSGDYYCCCYVRRYGGEAAGEGLLEIDPPDEYWILLSASKNCPCVGGVIP